MGAAAAGAFVACCCESLCRVCVNQPHHHPAPLPPLLTTTLLYRMYAGELQLVQPPTELDCYCSKACSSFTQQLAAQLVNPMERIKPSALHKAMAKPSHKPQQPKQQQQGVAAQGGGVTTMKSVIEVSEHWGDQLVALG